MSDGRYEILLAEAQRRLEVQQRDLEQLRARASWVISAAAVSTSFLGAGLIRVQAIEPLGGVAIVLFAVTIGLALWALAGPVTAMPDGFSPRLVEAEWIRARGLSEDELRLNLALHLERAVDAHAQKLVGRRQALALAAITLGLEIGAWILQLT
jgi:hypothetical protein